MDWPCEPATRANEKQQKASAHLTPHRDDFRANKFHSLGRTSRLSRPDWGKTMRDVRPGVNGACESNDLVNSVHQFCEKTVKIFLTAIPK
jgi:hypothetical protein